MSEIKWTKELLEECRNERGGVFALMSKAAQNAICAVRRLTPENVEWFLGACWDACGGAVGCCSLNVYRLRPDWTPPELQEKPWVDIPVRKSNDDILLYRTPLGNEMQLVTALSCISFAGFVYVNNDGSESVCSSVRLPSGKDGPFSAPVAVRFWKECAK